MNGSGEFDAAYDRYKADIFRFIFHLTGNRAEAEDLFQETWLRLVRHGPLRPGGQDLKPWLLTIVLNLHRDALRRKRVRRRSPWPIWAALAVLTGLTLCFLIPGLAGFRQSQKLTLETALVLLVILQNALMLFFAPLLMRRGRLSQFHS
jgi:DNA-directed RNA polymerase specialized sigma24 family protein